MKKIIPYFFTFTILLSGCGDGPSEHHYLVAKRIEQGPQITMTLNVVRRFEKESWCKSELNGFKEENGFTGECVYEAEAYKPMFTGGPADHWYALRRVGRFPPSVVFYEFNPPLPEAIIVQQLKNMAPHTLQFAALHHAPAEVQIYSPKGELLQ